MNQCNVCGKSEARIATTEYIYRRDGGYLIVSDVPCEECLNCGERYFTAETLRKIEAEFGRLERLEKRPAKTITVPIEEFSTL